jgi:predicted phage tail protein
MPSEFTNTFSGNLNVQRVDLVQTNAGKTFLGTVIGLCGVGMLCAAYASRNSELITSVGLGISFIAGAAMTVGGVVSALSGIAGIASRPRTNQSEGEFPSPKQ